MRFRGRIWTIVFFVFCSLKSNGQTAIKGNFFDSLRYFDLSRLWHCNSIQNLEIEGGTFLQKPEKFGFPEPLGFIGDDYQRFYIHYASVQKSPQNFLEYRVKGKTKVWDNICSFTGTIRVTKAMANWDSVSSAIGIKRGKLVCSCNFDESPDCRHSGRITGELVTNFCIYRGQVFYDNSGGVSDEYANNMFIGKWELREEQLTMKCNWGDYRIPESGDLDIGAGDFSPNKKYLKNGWEHYSEKFDPTFQGKKASEQENSEWWK